MSNNESKHQKRRRYAARNAEINSYPPGAVRDDMEEYPKELESSIFDAPFFPVYGAGYERLNQLEENENPDDIFNR